MALSPGTAQAAACMMDVLKTVPGFLEAHVAGRAAYGTRNVVLAYGVRHPSGMIFHRSVELYEGAPGVFSIRAGEGLTPMVFEAWRACGVRIVQPPAP